MLRGHGDDIYYKNPLRSNFSSNVYFGRVSDELLEHLRFCLPGIMNYPEVDGARLVKLLSQKYNLPISQVMAVGGATEAIYLIAQRYQASKSLILIPSFSEYEDACSLNNHTIAFLENSIDITTVDYSIYNCVWICNPNNPDGKIWQQQTLRNIVEKHPQTTFIIDESYVDFVPTNISMVQSLNNLENVIILKSFTKKYGIPGLRLGYILCSASLADGLRRYLKPWNLSVMALEAGCFIMQNKSNFEEELPHWLAASKQLQQRIAVIDGLVVYPSDTVYFIVKSLGKSASEIKKELLDRYSLLIRDASNFRGLDAYCFRICSQGMDTDTLLVNALSKLNIVSK